MTFLKIALALTLTAGTLNALSTSAQAFYFETNDFGTNPLSKSDAKNDIFLESVNILDTDGNIEQVITDFSFVRSAKIVYNDEYDGGNSGAASADKGDNTTTGVKSEDPTVADLVTNLGTNNLNNIVDTEDRGSFQLDLSFEKAIDNLLIWERGNDGDAWGAGNSDLAVQALNDRGELVGDYLKISRNQWKNAGFYIDTKEIGGAQEVGSLGINIVEDLNVEGPVASIRFFSESGFNGPDWKFVGTDAARESSTKVPEPSIALSLGMLGSVFLMRKRGCVA